MKSTSSSSNLSTLLKLALLGLHCLIAFLSLDGAQVFEEKVMEQARHMAWVSAVVYFDERQRDVCWLMNTMLRTFEKSGAGGGKGRFHRGGGGGGAGGRGAAGDEGRFVAK